VIELKKRLEALLLKGDHEWYDTEGNCKRMRGCTLLASATLKADEKAGTSAVKLGDELIYEGNFDGTKKTALNLRRADSGWPLVVNDNNLLLLELPPAKQKLYFIGRLLEEEVTLGEVGLKHDEELVLEFESPAMPEILKKMRAAPGEGGAKEKKKGGKKKK